MKNTQLKPKKNQNSKINYGASIVPNSWLYLGIIVMLGCLGFYAYRYLQIQALTQKQDIQQGLEQPESTGNINSNVVTKEQLSPEDLSVAADLGNIDVLLKEMEQNTDRENFVSVKNISQNKNTKSNKSSGKNKKNSRSNSLKLDTKNKNNAPSLNKSINNSSIGKVIEPSSIKSLTSLSSNVQDAVTTDNNLSDSNPGGTNRSLKSIGRLYDRERNLNQQGLITTNPEQSNTINSDYNNNNSNVVIDQNSLRSASTFQEQFITVPGQTNQSGVVDNSTTSNNFNSTRLPIGNLSDYQIKLQDYNRLVPRDYLAQPRLGSQLNQIQNNGQSRVEGSGVPFNNLSGYQLQPQELNPFNPSARSLNTPNTANLSQPNSFSTNNDRSNSNNLSNSGLQPSGVLQPSGSLVIDN